jgi:hypothetical protein
VRLSSDGVPVLFRLRSTGSAARENLSVAESPAGRLRSLRLKGGEPPLFLDEALSLLPGSLPVLLLLLVPASAAAVVPLLITGGSRRPVALLSPSREELLSAASLLPGAPRALLTARPSLSDSAFCVRHSLPAALSASALTTVRSARLEKDGVWFLAHGVETPSLRDRALSLGASALLTRHLSRLLSAEPPQR